MIGNFKILNRKEKYILNSHFTLKLVKCIINDNSIAKSTKLTSKITLIYALTQLYVMLKLMASTMDEPIKVYKIATSIMSLIF